MTKSSIVLTSIEKKSHDNAKFHSFHITLSKDDEQKVMEPELWPHMEYVLDVGPIEDMMGGGGGVTLRRGNKNGHVDCDGQFVFFLFF